MPLKHINNNLTTTLSKLPKELSLWLYLVLFLKVSYSLFKISEDPFGGGETRKISPKVFVFDFFGLIVGLYQYMIYNNVLYFTYSQ